MRYFFIPILITLLFVGCQKKSDATKITGSISGMGNDTIYLYSIDDSSEALDTIIVNNNHFIHTTTVDTLTTNLLLFSDGTEFPLFIEKSIEIEINGDSASHDRLRVKGGQANETYARFLDQVVAADTTGQTLQEVAEAFILNNRTSPVSIYLLEKHFINCPQPNFEKIKTLIQSMSGTLQDDPRIVAFNEIVSINEKSQQGKLLPFFSLNNRAGKKVTRSDNFKDKYLVLNFWASWNDSSRLDNRQMRKIYKKYRKSKDVGLLSISFDINKEEWNSAIKKDTLNWEQLSDFSGMTSPLLNTFSVNTIPTTMLIGKNGRIIARDIAPDSIAKLLDAEIKAEEKRAAEAKKKK